MFFEIFPEFREGFESDFMWRYRVSFVIYEIHEFISFWSVGDHDEWESMCDREDTRVESHTDDSIERWIEFQGLLDTARDIILSALHDATDEEEIILAFETFGRVHEEYRIVSLFDEIIIHFRDIAFILSEESTTQ